jgi:hypothetical protein
MPTPPSPRSRTNAPDNGGAKTSPRGERAQVRSSWGTITSAIVAVMALAVSATSLVFSIQAKGRPLTVANAPDAPFRVIEAGPPEPVDVRSCPDKKFLQKHHDDSSNLTVGWKHSNIDSGRMVATVSYWRDEADPRFLGVGMLGAMGLRESEDIPLGNYPAVPTEGACGALYRKSRESSSDPEVQYAKFENLFPGEIYCFAMFPGEVVSEGSEWTECGYAEWETEWGEPDIKPK